MKRKLWVIAEIGIVFVLLSLPGSKFPKQESNFPIDKIVHIILFCSLAFSFLFYYEKSSISFFKTTRAKAYTILLCILYGIGMEFYQKYYVPTRGFEIADMLADAIGALIALPLFEWIKKLKNR
jgi:VanZ family protein